MFFIHHPRPVIDGRAVAVQVVQQKITREPIRHVLAPAPAYAAPIGDLQAAAGESVSAGRASEDQGPGGGRRAGAPP